MFPHSKPTASLAKWNTCFLLLLLSGSVGFSYQLVIPVVRQKIKPNPQLILAHLTEKQHNRQKPQKTNRAIRQWKTVFHCWQIELKISIKINTSIYLVFCHALCIRMLYVLSTTRYVFKDLHLFQVKSTHLKGNYCASLWLIMSIICTWFIHTLVTKRIEVDFNEYNRHMIHTYTCVQKNRSWFQCLKIDNLEMSFCDETVWPIIATLNQ